MIMRVKPANSDSIPPNKNIGNELAVLGSVSATSAACGAAGAAAGGGWTTAVTGTSSPVGWTAASGTVFKVSTVTTSLVSTGMARTGSCAIFASSMARFLGYTNSWPHAYPG